MHAETAELANCEREFEMFSTFFPQVMVVSFTIEAGGCGRFLLRSERGVANIIRASATTIIIGNTNRFDTGNHVRA